MGKCVKREIAITTWLNQGENADARLGSLEVADLSECVLCWASAGKHDGGVELAHVIEVAEQQLMERPQYVDLVDSAYVATIKCAACGKRVKRAI